MKDICAELQATLQALSPDMKVEGEPVNDDYYRLSFVGSDEEIFQFVFFIEDALKSEQSLRSSSTMTEETHNTAQGITIRGIQDGVLVCQQCHEAFASCDADPLCPGCHTTIEI